MPQTCIGVDVSKDWIDAFDLSTEKVARISMTKQGLAKFCKAAKGALVVFEASGGYERPLIEALTRAEVAFVRVNPRHAREFARSTGRLAKTDQVDAGVLAKMARALELRPTPPTPRERVELGDLVARREDLVVMITAERNRAGQSRDAWIRAQIASQINAMIRQRKAVEARIAALVAAHAPLAEANRRLQSAPGIGPTIAATILAGLPELGQLDRRQLASLAGLAPHAHDSGTFHGKRRIWGGRGAITRALYLAAFVATRRNPRLKAFRQHLQDHGKPLKVALIACARKLLTILNAMFKKGETYAPNAI